MLFVSVAPVSLHILLGDPMGDALALLGVLQSKCVLTDMHLDQALASAAATAGPCRDCNIPRTLALSVNTRFEVSYLSEESVSKGDSDVQSNSTLSRCKWRVPEVSSYPETLDAVYM